MWWWVWGFLQFSPDPISPPAPSCYLAPHHRHLQPLTSRPPKKVKLQRGTHKWKVQPHTATSGGGSQQMSPLPSAPGFTSLCPGAILLHPPQAHTAGNTEWKEKNTPPYFSIYFQPSGQLRLSLPWQSITGSSATTCGQEAVFTQKLEVLFRRKAIFPVRRDHFFGGGSECEGYHPKSRACPGCQWDNDLIPGEREHSGERERASF